MRGPCTDSSVVPEVTSVTVHCSPSRSARRTIGSTRRWIRSEVTTRNRCVTESGDREVGGDPARRGWSHWV